jgi:uncharacterized protein (TIGR02271 family)
MSMNRETLTVHEGMDVVGSDGEKLGSVHRVEGGYLVAQKGWLFPSDYYIPASAITGVQGEQVILNVTKDEVLNQGWESAPAQWSESDAYTTANAGGGSAFADEASLIGAAPGATTTAAEYETRERNGTLDTDEKIRVPLSEEELTATRRPVQRGEVRVEKDVVEEEQSLDVPVTEERVNVTRRTVDRDADAGDLAFESETIDVPVRGEEVDVQKHARVTEEIEISKEAVDETQQVTGTVRKERARVTDTTGDIDETLDDTMNR